MKAIFKREFKAYFCTPIGYIVLASLYFILGLNFMNLYKNGYPKIEVIMVSFLMQIVMLIVVPILTMRIFSEDRRQKVDQALLTAPVSLVGIVLGKFFAAFVLFALGFLPTVIFEAVIMSYISVNVLSYLYALLGVLLFGAVLISIGMFISSLTESSVVSAILSVIVNIIILLLPSITSLVSNEVFQKVINEINLLDVLISFSESIFSIPNIIYFLSITAAFLFLCVRSLEKRRWS